jgi:hypothetical protein
MHNCTKATNFYIYLSLFNDTGPTLEVMDGEPMAQTEDLLGSGIYGVWLY